MNDLADTSEKGHVLKPGTPERNHLFELSGFLKDIFRTFSVKCAASTFFRRIGVGHPSPISFSLIFVANVELYELKHAFKVNFSF